MIRRGVVWTEPRVVVEVTYWELVLGRLCDPGWLHGGGRVPPSPT